MPKKAKYGIGDVLIWLVIAFLVAKFLGLTKAYLNIDPFGLEFNLEFVWAPMAVGIGVLYNEMRGLRKEMLSQNERILNRLQEHGERIAKLEVKMNKS